MDKMIETTIDDLEFTTWLSTLTADQLRTILSNRSFAIQSTPSSSHELAQRLLNFYALEDIIFHLTLDQLQGLLDPHKLTPQIIVQLSERGLAWHTDNGWRCAEIQRFLHKSTVDFLRSISSNQETLIAVTDDSAGRSSVISTIFDTLYLCERIMEIFDATPVRLKNNGEIYTAQWRKIAKTLAVTPEKIGWIIDLLHELDLFEIVDSTNYHTGYDNSDHSDHDKTSRRASLRINKYEDFFATVQKHDIYAIPSPKYEHWKNLDFYRKWFLLAATWVNSFRCYSTSASETTTSPPNPMSVKFRSHKQWQRIFLETYTYLTPTEHFTDSYRSVIHYRPLVAYALSQPGIALIENIATQLGILENNRFSDLGALLIANELSHAEHLAQQLFPASCTHCVIDNDHTITVSGPPEPKLHNFLISIADQESGGMGAVYRINATKIRESLDNGRDPGTLIPQLQQYCSIPIPQAIVHYLNEVSAHHGENFIGSAHSFIITKDPSTLSELLAQENVATHLHAISPTVAISQLPKNALRKLLANTHIHWSLYHEDILATPDSAQELSDFPDHLPDMFSDDSREDLLTLPVIVSYQDHIDDVITAISQEEKIFNAPIIAESEITLDGSPDYLYTLINFLRSAQQDQQTIRLKFSNNSGKSAYIFGVPFAVNRGIVSFLHPRGIVKEVPFHRITSVALINTPSDPKTTKTTRRKKR